MYNKNISEKELNVLANCVPEEEQAVEQTETFAPHIAEPLALSLAVPQDEQAVDDEEYRDELSLARENGFFSEHFGMSNIKGVLDDRLYAAHRIDEEGNHYFDFCERYSDGSFSSRMTIAQSDLFSLVQTNNSGAKDAVITKVKSNATKALAELVKRYLLKYRGDELPLSLQEVFRVLIIARPNLPVQDNRPKILPAEEFYQQVIAEIKEHIKKDFPHKAYYALTGDDLQYLAELMEMKKLELLKKLKEYNFLYLTESSRGHQTNVRFKLYPNARDLLDALDPELKGKDSYTEWSYCIYKMEYLAKVAGIPKI